MVKELIFYIIFFSLGISQNKVQPKDLVRSEDKLFIINSNIPFEGIVFNFSKVTDASEVLFNVFSTCFIVCYWQDVSLVVTYNNFIFWFSFK